MRSKKAEWVALEMRQSVGEALSVEERMRYDALLQELPCARTERAWIDRAATLLQQPAVDAAEAAALQRVRQATLDELSVRPHPHLRLLSPRREPELPREPSQRDRHPSARPPVWSVRWWVPLALGLTGVLGVWGWHAGWQQPAEPQVFTSNNPGPLAAPVTLTDGAVESSEGRAEPASLARAELFLAAGEVWVDERSPEMRLLSAGERITTGAGTACITVDPEIEVCFAEQTRATLSRLERHAVEVHVDEGTAVARLSPRSAGHGFALSTEGIRATAKGTVFSVTRHGSTAAGSARATSSDAPVEILVLEGTVEVTQQGDGAPITARAHTRVRGGGTAASSSEPVGRQSEGELWRLLGSEQWLRDRQVGTLSVEANGADDTVLLDDEGPYRLPLRVVLPAGPHRLRRPGQSSERVVEITAGQHTAERGASLSVVRRTAAQHLARAREHLHSGERRAALDAYRQLLAQHPKSAEARTVAITVAQLELEVGSAERALRGFERYLASPGALAPEALAGKVAALKALGRSSEARHAARAYLERYPRGPHAESMRRSSQPRSER